MAKKQAVGRTLQAWRDDKNYRLDEAAVYASELLPRRISRETIRRYEVGDVAPDKMDVDVIQALCRVYGRSIDDLPPIITDRAEKLRSLFATLTPRSSSYAAAAA